MRYRLNYRTALHRLPILAGILIVVLAMASCRSIMCGRPGSEGGALASMCSSITEPFRSVDHRQVTRAAAAEALLNHRVKPPSIAAGKRNLNRADCRRLALANNLELQTARVNELTKRAIDYSNQTRVLPHFIFSGDLSERDNQSYSFSDVLGQEGVNPNPAVPKNTLSSGTGVTNYSSGHERSTWRYLLETRWSPTDAALAYYIHETSTNDSLKAHYEKVRVGQKLVGLADATFFRLLALQECWPVVSKLLAARSKIAESTKLLYSRKIASAEEYDRANQNLIRARRLFAKIRTEIEKQRNVLASAVGLTPDYTVDGGFVVTGELIPPDYSPEMSDLEMQAVQNRPEAYEAGLNYLNSTNDLKRTIIKYMPKVSGFWRFTRDKDRFLYNKDWKEVGVAVYFDLLDWFSNVNESKAAGFASEKTYKEVGFVALGITSQVRVAALQYLDSLDELRITQAAEQSSQNLAKVAQRRVSIDDLDRLSLEDAKANHLHNILERIRAIGEANALLAELNAATGTNYQEPLPEK
jgi:outer membrane protein TolC